MSLQREMAIYIFLFSHLKELLRIYIIVTVFTVYSFTGFSYLAYFHKYFDPKE
jgi:hypothetical protein